MTYDSSSSSLLVVVLVVYACVGRALCMCVCTSFSLISSVCVFVSDEELLRFAVEVEPKDGKREQNARHR